MGSASLDSTNHWSEIVPFKLICSEHYRHLSMWISMAYVVSVVLGVLSNPDVIYYTQEDVHRLYANPSTVPAS